MARAIITEYDKLGKARNGTLIQAGQEPAIVDQLVTFSSATLSAKFQDRTTFIRIIADADANLLFGDSGVSANADNKRIVANVPEFFAVTGGDYVSVYDGTT